MQESVLANDTRLWPFADIQTACSMAARRVAPPSSGYLSLPLLPTDQIGYALGDHDGRQIGVGAWHVRHHGGVDDAQIGQSVNPARRVDNRHRIVGSADRTGADRMCHWCGRCEQFLIA